MRSEYYDAADDALRAAVEAQAKPGFLAKDLKDTVQRWADLN